MKKQLILSCMMALGLVGCASIAPSAKTAQNTANTKTTCAQPLDLLDRDKVESPLKNVVYQRTSSLNDVEKLAKDLAKTQSVLVVFDIDDTLLQNTSASELGSTAWYNWQAKLLADGATDPCSVAKGDNRFNELYNLINLNYVVLDLTLTEPDTADILSALNAAGIATHALTARSPKYIGATLRELDDNGLTFNSPNISQPVKLPACSDDTCMAVGIIPHPAVERLMVDTFGCEALRHGNTKLSGFSGKAGCAEYTKPTPPFTTDKVFGRGRSIVIANGVMSVEGQNKGLMLEYLLQSFGTTQFDQVIFVDDSPQNIANLYAVKTLADPDSRLNAANLTLFYYDQFDNHVKFLGDRDKLTHVKQQMDDLVCATKPFGQIKDSIGRVCKH